MSSSSGPTRRADLAYIHSCVCRSECLDLYPYPLTYLRTCRCGPQWTVYKQRERWLPPTGRWLRTCCVYPLPGRLRVPSPSPSPGSFSWIAEQSGISRDAAQAHPPTGETGMRRSRPWHIRRRRSGWAPTSREVIVTLMSPFVPSGMCELTPSLGKYKF